MNKTIKLSQWAENHGFSYRGAYDLYKRGGIPNAYSLPTGTIMIPVENTIPSIKEDYTIIYARVSTPAQKLDLDRQVAYVSEFCAANGWVVNKVYKEVASGLNDNRSQLNKIFENSSITRVVVSEKDRLTRFGFNYLKKLFELNKVELVVINTATNNEHDLMQDFVSVITSMAARVYGLRRHKTHVESILNGIKH
jgi:predicted site-specific integrase-resolvase